MILENTISCSLIKHHSMYVGRDFYTYINTYVRRAPAVERLTCLSCRYCYGIRSCCGSPWMLFCVKVYLVKQTFTSKWTSSSPTFNLTQYDGHTVKWLPQFFSFHHYYHTWYNYFLWITFQTYVLRWFILTHNTRLIWWKWIEINLLPDFGVFPRSTFKHVRCKQNKSIKIPKPVYIYIL